MNNLLKMTIIALIVCFSVSAAQALSVGDSQKPTVNNVYINGIDSPALVSTVQGFIDIAWATALANANTELQKYGDQPDLAKGFANANAYAAQAGTLQGFQDYSLFAVTTGVMVGAQLPSSNKDYYNDLDKKVEEKGDIYAGAGYGLAIINAGINAGFIYPGLYLNAKFGYFSMDDIGDKFSVKNTLVGIGANYTWIQTKSLLVGLIKWRGISFGTGFLYNKSETDFKLELDPITEGMNIDFTSAGYPGLVVPGEVVIDPTIVLGIKSTTYSIPLDVTTSIRLLWVFNFNLGAGIDFNFGSTDIIIKPKGAVNANIPDYTGTPTVSVNTTPGTFTVDGSTKDKKPSWVRERITTGVGLNLGPVKIDVPVIIYPFDSAFAVGVTAGIVW